LNTGFLKEAMAAGQAPQHMGALHPALWMVGQPSWKCCF